MTGARETARRIWARDAALWRDDPARAAAIRDRLGWLEVAAAMRPLATELTWWTRDLKREGFERAVLLGMGGSSLAPEMFRRVFGASPAGLELEVLDSTDPAQVRAATGRADPKRTLVLVSSKSGGTIEVEALYRQFHHRMRMQGDRFVAITDPGTSLERMAAADGFRRVFRNPPDIGGRYSALSYFGLVPAALLGVDTGRLLNAALDMTRRCGPEEPVADHPGLALGAFLGMWALAGRDKLTLVADPRLEAFGLWVEQLLAESTGKEGTGIVPVAGESLGGPEEYAADRAFVSVALGAEAPEARDRLAALEAAGHPVFRTMLNQPLDLGAEIFRWEFATAVAGAQLGIDPFDQPDVQEAKDRTKALLRTYETDGALPNVETRPPGEVLRGLAAGKDYLALLAYLPFDSAYDRAFAALRDALRRRWKVPVTFGYGPRYLHSTGQLHKGGPAAGAFLVFTADRPDDLKVPEHPWTFGTLQAAQALGDLAALAARGKAAARVHLPDPSPAQMMKACEELIVRCG